MDDPFQNASLSGAIALLVSFGLCFVILFPLYWWRRSRSQTEVSVTQGAVESAERSNDAQAVTPTMQVDEHCENVTELNIEESVEQLQQSPPSIAEFAQCGRNIEHEEVQSIAHVDGYGNDQGLNDLRVLDNDTSIAVSDIWGDEPDDDSKPEIVKEPVDLQEGRVELATSGSENEQEVQQTVVQVDETQEILPSESRPPLDLSGVQLLRTKTKVAVKASDLTIPVPTSIPKRKISGHDCFYLYDLQTVFKVTLREEPIKRPRSGKARRKSL
jgi:hypothetical protein